jgi:hypothetical protein
VALVGVLLILMLGASLVIGMATWVAGRRSALRNIVAFCFAAGASYSMGFLINLWVLTSSDGIPRGNVGWPSFTWLSIALICFIAARMTLGSPFALALPFLINAAFVLLLVPSARGKLTMGTSLSLIAAGAFFAQRGRSPAPKRDPSDVATTSFPVGPYRLDDALEDFTGLKEFSEAEYAVMGRQFEGAANYNAPPVKFLDRPWNLSLQVVNGQIVKIAPHVLLLNKSEANLAAMQTLQFCNARLGAPAEQRTGLIRWHTADGNVILQTAETKEGMAINLFLTAKSIRGLRLL